MKINFTRSLPKLIFSFIIIITLVGIILNPTVSLESAASGLSTWVNIVIPSILPFLIISEILIQLGFVDFIGKLLGPLMIPLFKLPGESAFPITMSLISGYPVGAKLTSRLREEKLLTRDEANRLISFTSTSGPLFMLGAISISILDDPKLAPLILIPHYLSVFVLGLISRLYSPGPRYFTINNKKSLLDEMKISYSQWLKIKKPIGSVISKSIRESMDTMILIGGSIIFYSVLVAILFNFSFVDNFIIFLEKKTPFTSNFIQGFLSGLFEVTVGCKRIASSNISLIHKILVINFLVGWSGLSVHSQALGFISNTDINERRYIFSKFLHGVFATIFTYLLYIIKYKNYIQPTFTRNPNISLSMPLANWIKLIYSSTKLALLMGWYILFISLVISLIFKILVRSP